MQTDFEELKKEFSSKTIYELDSIISNTRSLIERRIAISILDMKRNELKNQNLEKVTVINQIIKKQEISDFQIISYDKTCLVVGGSFDLTYYHTLEIIFTDVFFFKGYFEGWQADFLDTVFEIPKNEKELNLKYEIEHPYQLFVFRTDNKQNDIIIAANSVSYNTDTVFYYNRPDLKDNERIAYFVKN